MLYLAVKLTGALYLIWLGLCLLRTPRIAAERPPQGVSAGRGAFLQSIAVEVLNPKTALFFLAFLPQFIDPAATAAVWLQFVVLGTIVNLMFSTADLACVILAGSIVAGLRRSSRAQRLMRRAGGTILVGLGAHLALQRS